MDYGDEPLLLPSEQGLAAMTESELQRYYASFEDDDEIDRDDRISALSFDTDSERNNKESDFVKTEEMKEPKVTVHAIAQPKTYRKLPVEVQGVKWTGTNVHAMRDFVGKRGARNTQDPETGAWLGSSGEWNFLTPVEISGVMESSAIVWDSVQKGWIPVHIGDTILCGVSGEFYPISEEVLRKTYEEVK